MDGVRVGDYQREDLRSPRHEHHLCCYRPFPRAQVDCHEQIISEKTTQNTFENPTMHEQVIVQEISHTPLHCCVFSRIPIEFGLYFSWSPRVCWTLQWILSLPPRTLLSLVWQVSLLFPESELDLTVDFGTCVARACSTHVQPSPSRTHRCDSTASPGLVNPQFSNTDVEAYAPQVVGSFPPFEEFSAPVYNQVHQEQIVAGEMTLNIVENPVVQEQVIVPEIPRRCVAHSAQRRFRSASYRFFV